jgi:hypothetical protein
MSVSRMCQLGHVGRAGLYRFEPEGEPVDEDPDLRALSSGSLWGFPATGGLGSRRN